MDRRIPDRTRAPLPDARFRCDVCQRFVAATRHGVCPVCGRAPIQLPAIAPARHAANTRRLMWAAIAIAGLAVLAVALLL